MPRTTMNIDASVLRELKARQRREGKSISQLASELLARALDEAEGDAPHALHWIDGPLRPTVDLDDKEAVRRALDHP